LPGVLPRENLISMCRCISGSSNPTADITWRFPNGTRVTSPFRVSSGQNGGNVSTSIMEVHVSADDDGASYSCEARNAALGESVFDAVSLKVKCELVGP